MIDHIAVWFLLGWKTVEVWQDWREARKPDPICLPEKPGKPDRKDNRWWSDQVRYQTVKQGLQNLGTRCLRLEDQVRGLEQAQKER